MEWSILRIEREFRKINNNNNNNLIDYYSRYEAFRNEIFFILST